MCVGTCAKRKINHACVISILLMHRFPAETVGVDLQSAREQREQSNTASVQTFLSDVKPGIRRNGTGSNHLREVLAVHK